MKLKLLFAFSMILCFRGISQNPVDLKLNYFLTDSFLIEYTYIAQNKQEIMGTPQDIRIQEDIVFIMTVNKILPNNAFIVQLSCKTYKSKIETQDILETFNSDSIVTNSELNYYKSFIGKKIAVNISNKGRIISYDNTSFRSDNDTLSNTDENAEQIAKKRFGEQIPKHLISLIYFPPNVIEAGEIWNSPDTVFLHPFYYYNIQTCINEINENSIRLTQTGKINSNEHQFFKTNRIFISYQLTGETENIVILDKKNNMFTDIIINQSIKGTIGMKYSENSDTEYKWPISINNKIIIKSQKL